MRTFKLVGLFLAIAACAELPPQNATRTSDWQTTLSYARQDVDAGNYFAADHVLDEYARTHPDTREAREIAFWRAAYLVDPANPRGSLGNGITALDAYLSDSTGWYRHEAIVLRRTAAAAQGATHAGLLTTAGSPLIVSIAPPDTSKDTVVVVSKSRDEEIALLRRQLSESKDELAKVSAELERIKKRLANPTQ
jgi:hypothetical protein